MSSKVLHCSSTTTPAVEPLRRGSRRSWRILQLRLSRAVVCGTFNVDLVAGQTSPTRLMKSATFRPPCQCQDQSGHTIRSAARDGIQVTHLTKSGNVSLEGPNLSRELVKLCGRKSTDLRISLSTLITGKSRSAQKSEPAPWLRQPEIPADHLGHETGNFPQRNYRSPKRESQIKWLCLTLCGEAAAFSPEAFRSQLGRTSLALAS